MAHLQKKNRLGQQSSQQSTSGNAKKRCNSPVALSFSPHSKSKRPAVILTSMDEASFSSFEERDSGLDTFISEGSDVSDNDPVTFHIVESVEMDEFLCKEETLDAIPLSKKMERIKKSDKCGQYDYDRSSKENMNSHFAAKPLGKEIRGYLNGLSLRKSFFGKTKRMNQSNQMFVREKRWTGEESLEECPLLEKENWAGYQRNPLLFNNHPELEPEMRSMLLDWMIQVTAAFYLQRRTYYMALDYVDRVLSFSDNLPKIVFQLLGISALYVAAKLEEISPPRIHLMADVTDGLHTVEDIKAMEIHILKILGTSFMPVTPCDWVGLWLHDAGLVGPEDDLRRRGKPAPKICRENYLPPQLYFRICRVIDLATMDHESLRYSYRHIATAALCLSDCDAEVVGCHSGLTDADLHSVSSCIQWMRPFAIAERDLPDTPPEIERKHARIVQVQHVQTFTFQPDTFLNAMQLKSSTPTGDSNPSCLSSSVFLTPPDSGSKCQSTEHSSTGFNFFYV